MAFAIQDYKSANGSHTTKFVAMKKGGKKENQNNLTDFSYNILIKSSRKSKRNSLNNLAQMYFLVGGDTSSKSLKNIQKGKHKA